MKVWKSFTICCVVWAVENNTNSNIGTGLGSDLKVGWLIVHELMNESKEKHN